MKNNGRNILIGIVVIGVLAFLGFNLFSNDTTTQAPSPSVKVQPESTALTQEKEMIVELHEQNNSSESGKAVLTEKDGEVVVTLTLDNAPQTEQPAHIHVGACPDPGAIRYPLSNVVNGKSETTILATLEDLKTQEPLAINVHESPETLETYVSCGDIKF